MRDDDEVTIRPARPDDAEAMAPLLTALGYPSTPEQVRARMERIGADADYHTLVAARGGRLVGMAGVRRGWKYTGDRPYAELMSLVVDAGERGRGTGAALVEAAEAWTRAQGGELLLLSTALHREGAHRFYERIGYAQTGRRYVKKLP